MPTSRTENKALYKNDLFCMTDAYAHPNNEQMAAINQALKE